MTSLLEPTDGLREQLIAALDLAYQDSYQTGYGLPYDEMADAVLAVRDQELERARATIQDQGDALVALAEERERLRQQLRAAEAGVAVADDLYHEWQQRAVRAEADRDQLRADLSEVREQLRLIDGLRQNHHDALTFNVERALKAEAELAAARNLATEQADRIRQQLDHTGRLEAAVARVRAQAERWRYTPDRKRAAAELLAELDRTTAKEH